MRRIVTILALLSTIAFAQQKAAPKKAVATPQTARQALIEMLTTKSDKVFERHLPDALLVRVEAMKSKDPKTGQSSSPMKTSNTAIVNSKDAHFFPAGPTFVTFTEPKTAQRIDVSIDRDDLTAGGNDFEFGFHLIKDGKESVSAFIPKLLVRMKQEGGEWRLAEVGFLAKLQLDDGEKLDELQNSIMSGMAALQQVKQQPKPAPHTKD
ncbi:MAG: hypothetical protein HYX28_10675 [Candidatus Koribacter versatilis]|uniref:SnoaL-like domain-containing protein n=1 Tax=Candidatus Korobacter versatilis TaxID=658062 RepID=A0A932A9P7_9BACT|nr:hypothetical protein [Candidatus Koribacter versatilis]